mgnify:CR=1 FL=1
MDSRYTNPPNKGPRPKPPLAPPPKRRADDDDDNGVSIEIRLGDGVQLVKFMLGLRALQREIAEDEPETARRIGELIDEWEKTK